MKNIYESYKKKINAYTYALWLLSWDQETEAPKKSLQYRLKQMDVLYSARYELVMSEERINAINALAQEEHDQTFKREIELEKKAIDQLLKIPKEEYLAYQLLTSESNVVWSEAKRKNDFNLFAPTLEKIIAYNKKVIKYLETDELKGYDVLLDMYEEKMSQKDYDTFFTTLNNDLVPFALKVSKQKQSHPRILTHDTFDIELQRKFNKELVSIFGYDLERGVLKESEHPFTSGVASVDTRITTAYHEDKLDAAIFSTIHEIGHAIYEQQVNEDYDGSSLSGGVSMGIHESQSRFYENMIGRSYVFWETHYPKLQKVFPKLKRVKLEDFYKYVNRVKCDFIRIDSDELTYSLHIMVRYEIEKQIFENNLPVKEIPKLWNKLYKEYLGVTVKKDSLGVLQDIHWAMGSFGYFPTYALGSAIAAQLYYEMSNDLNIPLAIKENKIGKINEWLKEHVHQYGALYTPKEVLEKATKEAFNPKYYVRYLKEKFRTIYEID